MTGAIRYDRLCHVNFNSRPISWCLKKVWDVLKDVFLIESKKNIEEKIRRRIGKKFQLDVNKRLFYKTWFGQDIFYPRPFWLVCFMVLEDRFLFLTPLLLSVYFSLRLLFPRNSESMKTEGERVHAPLGDLWSRLFWWKLHLRVFYDQKKFFFPRPRESSDSLVFLTKTIPLCFLTLSNFNFCSMNWSDRQSREDTVRVHMQIPKFSWKRLVLLVNKKTIEFRSRFISHGVWRELVKC